MFISDDIFIQGGKNMEIITLRNKENEKVIYINDFIDFDIAMNYFQDFIIDKREKEVFIWRKKSVANAYCTIGNVLVVWNVKRATLTRAKSAITVENVSSSTT